MNRTARSLIIVLIAAALGTAAAAQTSSGGSPVPGTFSQLTIPLSQPPQPVPSGSAQVVGNPGPQTFYYWVVSDYLIGNSSPAGPFLVPNAPNVLSAANYDVVNWSPAPGASSYDVLRTATPAAPSGACNCAVATGVTGGSVLDQSNTLLSYTVSSLDPSSLAWTLTNQGQSAGVGKLSFAIGGGEKWSVDSTGGASFTSLSAKTIGAVAYADHFPGSDAGAKISACLAYLGAEGGVCDARALTGAQTVGENMFAGAAGPDVIRFGAATYTFTAPQAVSYWTRLQGDVFGSTTFVFTPTSGTFVTWNTAMAPGGDGAGSLQLAGQGFRNIRIEGPTHADPDVAIFLGGSSGAIGVSIRDCTINYWGTAIEFGDNAYDDTVADSVIEWNGTGILFPAGITNSGEKIHLLDDFIADSPSGLPGVDIEGSGADFVATGSSFDFLTNAVTMGSGSAGGTFTCLGCHFEDDSTNFIEAVSGNISVYGGSWIFDATTGTAATMADLSGNANLEIQGVSIQTLGVTVTDLVGGSTTGTVTVANDQIAVGNFTNIEATQANGYHFGLQQLGVTGLGGAFANNGVIVGAQDCGQGFHWGAYGAIATDPYLCEATGTNATELEFGTNGSPVFEISATGLALPSTYTVGFGGYTITQPAVSGTLALSGANGSSRGTISISAATSGSHTFGTAYSAAPVCTAALAGTTPPATALSFAVSSTTTAVTVTLSASGTATFNWSCGPAVN